MKYNLWDTETSNLFGQFEDECEALILVRTLVGHYGASYADELALGRMTDEGAILEPLTGVPLMARADEVLGDCGQGDHRRGEVNARLRRTTTAHGPERHRHH